MKAATKSHPRFDRLMAPRSTPEEIACHSLCAAFDRAARDMDIKWGINRLLSLVSGETAAKWGAVLGRLNEALNADDKDAVAKEVAIAVRGWAAMDAEATRLGHAPAPPEAWQLEVEGTVCAIIRDGDMWPALAAQMPGVRIYTMQEVAVALAALNNVVVNSVKEHFPGATVTAIRPRTQLEQDLEDEIPW